MFIQSRKIEIEEYSSADVRLVDRRKLTPITPTIPSKSLSFGPLRIVTEWVKGVHAEDLPKRTDRTLANLETTAACQRLTARLRYGAGENLRLRGALMGSYEGIRDFSKSSRVGEYGQAICRIFVQDQLIYPIVFDYDIFCALAGAIVLSKNETKPDFVGWDGEYFVLVESKASLGSGAIKTTLREGLLQCDAGSANLSLVGYIPAASFCVLTTFQLDTSTEDSSIHFADPEGEPSTPEGTHKLLIDEYYRTTLEALGWFGDLTKLLAENADRRVQTLFRQSGRRFVELPDCEKPAWIEEMSPELGLYSGHYSLWIDFQVLSALRSNNGKTYKEVIRQYYNAVGVYGQDLDGNEPIVQFFKDGLAIVIERPTQFPLPNF